MIYGPPAHLLDRLVEGERPIDHLADGKDAESFFAAL
jgi:hypothetical protein